MPSNLSLDSNLNSLPHIGTVYTRRLSALGINSLRDLLYYFPFRYEDLSEHKSIAELSPGDKVTIQARLWQITKINTKYGKTLIKATVNDGNGSLDVVWFNQAYLLTILKPNQLINFSGKVGLFNNKLTLTNPTHEIINTEIATPLHTDRLVPIYSEANGVGSKWLRTKIHQILSLEILPDEYLPEEVIEKEKLPNLPKALRQIHFPENLNNFLEAKKRLAFEELLLLHLRNLKITKEKNANKVSPILDLPKKEKDILEKSLPFKLTSSQKSAISDILADLALSKPMNRLLQGEVGSGKTVVSAFAFLACIHNKFQAALLAPTEVLARQHHTTLQRILGDKVNVKLVTGSSKPDLTGVEIVVGTHALLNQTQYLQRLGLVIIDEQQRFGVLQRSTLKLKEPTPHFLTMTATPIPRTLALTLYGQLDISVLDELPSGRKAIKTYLVPTFKRKGAYDFIRKEIKTGGQAYIICPLIEESESLLTVKSAKKEYERLQKEIFPDLRLALLHGKLTNKEKTQILQEFREGLVDILISTPVVEVGIDVPNASIMVIEGADRFGLASLHQLRGRVGRGERQSYCLLFTESRQQAVQERLKLMEVYQDGFKLAEMDLERRGPGEMYGILQHGELGLKLANTSDLGLILQTREWAEKLVEKPLPKEIEAEIEKQTSVVSQTTTD